MALSDVLQFDYSIDNEIARNATKNFARMLEQAFEQYKNIWAEYLKLRKHCEDADFKIPFQLLESDIHNNKDVITPDRDQISKNAKMSTSLYNSMSTSSSSDINSGLDNAISSDNKFTKKQSQKDELSRSPILLKKRFRFKRTNVTNDSILENIERSVTHPCLPIKENISILTDSTKENIIPETPNKHIIIEDNNDEIECTPMVKMQKTLGINKLYNVDTTLLQNGKKCRQTKLAFLPNEQSTNTAIYEKHKRSDHFRSHISLSPKKNIKKWSKHHNKSIEEEIIENSPNKRMKSNLKMRSFKNKSKTPTKFTDTRNNVIPIEFSDTKLGLKEINQSSFDQYLPPACTSTEKDQGPLIIRSNTFGSCNENVKNDSDTFSSPLSELLTDVQHLCSENVNDLSIPVKETKKLDIKENTISTEKRKYLESTSPMSDIDSSTGNDETFFLFGEKLKKTAVCDINELKVIKESTFENKLSSESPPVKKCLMDSFDMLPEKKDIYIDKSKKQSERAKLYGVPCWECKKYYANLGIPEQEVKVRQNQCSRHRTKYNERQDTPEGFWDPVFPDAYSSTLED